MKPKEKAKNLVGKYEVYCWKNGVCEIELAKEFALIAVDEIRDNLPLILDIQQYWIDVKQEINKL